jgi:lysophospholipase L1-like esterase
MRLKLVYFIFILFFLLSGSMAYYFVRKYYLFYNFLRLDPLEDRSLKKDLLITPDNITNVWMIGDSRIARWNMSLLSPLDASIVNLGIEGQSTAQVLNRLNNYLKIGNPQWIILEAGINDLKIIGLKKDSADQIVEDCLENIYEIIDLCLINEIRIIVINIIPPGKIELLRRLVWNSAANESIDEANRKLKDYCHGKKVFFLDTYPILCTDNSKVQEQYQDGFLHINESGYKVMSKRIIEDFGIEINSKLTSN